MLIVFLAPSCFAAEPLAHAESKANLTILIDANLMLPVAKIARLYAKTGHTPLTLVVKNSAEVQEEIGQGLEAHVVLTANTELIDQLAEQGLTDVSSSRAVARTQLALVASNQLENREVLVKHLSFAATLYATPDVPVYLDAPLSDANERAQALMQGYPFSPQLGARARPSVSHAILLASLAQDPGLALMLATDAVGQPGLTVLNVLPDSLSKPVQYTVVVLASESMNEARQFAQFLTTPPAQAIFSQFGFQPPGE